MAAQPLNQLVLGATSVAEDLSYVALTDISSIRIDGEPLDFRLIGGQMVSLHVQRWALSQSLYRQTLDADLGVMPLTVVNTDFLDQIRNFGYRQIEGNRFTKTVSDIGTGQSPDVREAVIDILVPAFTSRPRSNFRVGQHLVTTEVTGLAEPFLSDPVIVSLNVTRLNGQILKLQVMIPDETSALALKAFAWDARSDVKDAIDIWRMLEVASVAGVTSTHFNTEGRMRAALIVIQNFSEPGNTALRKIADTLQISAEEELRLHTRIRALIKRVLSDVG